MKKISGILNVYFPFELKETYGMKTIGRIYEKRRDTQIMKLQYSKRPRTDLLDKKKLRKQMEDVLALGLKLMKDDCNQQSSPYATSNIAKAFHLSREDNLFSKEVCTILSDFKVVCQGVNTQANPMFGRLYYFNNFGNHVGTYIIALQYHDLTVDDAMRLKHAFYKRALVQIEELSTILYKKESTFQDYIYEKDRKQAKRRKTDIDCRARYTFMEIDDLLGNDKLLDKELCGLVASNEKNHDLKKIHLKDYSELDSYSLYYDLRSALVVNHKLYDSVIKSQRLFFGKLKFSSNNIAIEFPLNNDMIAGLNKEMFPLYLKAVELHLLTNNVQRQETVRHELSYWNPYIFLKRRYKIWKILNELDVSNCYIDRTMLEKFGVNENLKKIEEEYKRSTTHVVNYFALMVSFAAMLIAIFKP